VWADAIGFHLAALITEGRGVLITKHHGVRDFFDIASILLQEPIRGLVLDVFLPAGKTNQRP
jgi:hypothetical protein